MSDFSLTVSTIRPFRIGTSLQQMVLQRHTQTLAHTLLCPSLSHCGSRLVQLLLGSDINTEQIGGDLQPLLFDLSSSCHISWHCPPATPRGAGRTGMASTCLPGLFSVFFLVQLIPSCPLHGCSSADYKSSPTPSDSPHLWERLVLIPERPRLHRSPVAVFCPDLASCPHSLFQV